MSIEKIVMTPDKIRKEQKYRNILKESGFLENEVEERVLKLRELNFLFPKSKHKEKLELLYTPEVAEQKRKEQCNKKFKLSKESLIKLYGEDEGLKKWKNYCEKRAKSYEKRKESGVIHNNGRSLEEYIKRHGEKEGLFLWEIRNKKQKDRFNIEYYISKFGEIEGIKEYLSYLKSMDKVSLKSFIKKYGKEDGKERYISFVEKNKINKLSSQKDYIEKYGETLGKLKYKKWLKKIGDSLKVSTKIRRNSYVQKFFWWLYDLLDEKYKNKIKFKELNGEEVIYCFTESKKFYMIDFKCGNAIIEFQGTLFHINKIQDKIKKDFLESKGYKVLEIFEENFKKDKFEQLEKSIKFIKENA